jgi:hypothetical protein
MKPTRPIFGIMSIVISVLAYICLTVGTGTIDGEVFLLLVLICASLAGFLFAAIAFARRERLPVIATIGLIGNVGFVGQLLIRLFV